MSGTPRLIAVLPFAPSEREAHAALVQAAASLHAAAPLDILQLVPLTGALSPLAPEGARWWELASPAAAQDAAPATLAALLAPALARDDFRGAGQRLILLPPGPLGEELAALLAAELDGASLGRCTALTLEAAAIVARRAAFGGRLTIDLRSGAATCCASWRAAPSAVPALQAPTGDAIRRIALEAPAGVPPETELVESADAQTRLDGAALVVSGGRGMDGPEGFALLARIAAPLGAAVGGSLPAVDAGWVPVARQIGQSGQFVSPRLYFAVAVSGTPQHLAGVSTQARIVALNRDPDASIFGVAEAGVVADWRAVLPLLARRLEARQPDRESD